MMDMVISEVINTQWELQKFRVLVCELACTVGIPDEAFSKCLIKEHLHYTLLYYEELKHFY